MQIASNAMMVTEQDLQSSINQAISDAVIALLKQELSAQEANIQLKFDLLNIQ